MAETKEQKQQRMLDELKGKNVAHYSVILGALPGITKIPVNGYQEE